MHDSNTVLIVTAIMFLLFIASMTALFAKKIKFPFSIFLVLIGLVIAWLAKSHPGFHILTLIHLTPDLVFFIFLPILIYESAFKLDSRQLIKNMAPILILSIPALLISTFVIGYVLHLTIKLDLGVALVFGALISATDPVAVIALFKEMGAPKRLTLLVEGESLFNDGTALVLFKILLGIVLAGQMTLSTAGQGAIDFIIVFAGGVLTGGVLGYFFSRIIGIVENDRLVEITLTIILAFASFLIADRIFHVSGVMAVVAAGTVMGSYGRTKISPRVIEPMESFWEFLGFLCNSLIFLIVGLTIDLNMFVTHYQAVIWAFIAVTVARAVGVFGLVTILGKMRIIEKVSMPFQTIIFWGGLRGAVAVVMAISIPESFQYRDFILVLTLSIVLFTLVLQGLSIKSIMKFLKLDKFSRAENFEMLQAGLEGKQILLNELNNFTDEVIFHKNIISKVRSTLESERKNCEIDMASFHSEGKFLSEKEEEGLCFRHCLLIEKIQYLKLFEHGFLEETNFKEMLNMIEAQLDRIKENKDISKPMKANSMDLNKTVPYKRNALSLVKSLFGSYKTTLIAGEYEKQRSRYIAFKSILKDILRLEESGMFSREALEKASLFYNNLIDKTLKQMRLIQAQYPEYVEKTELNIMNRFVISRELEAFEELFHRGVISDKVYYEQEVKSHFQISQMQLRPVSELQIPPMKLLGNIPYFSEFTSEELLHLGAHFKARSFLPQEIIVEEGTQGDSLFIIGRGIVEVHVRDKSGAPVLLSTLKAGDFFGETALLHPQPRTATVTAIAPAILLELDRKSFLPMLEKAPRLKNLLEDAYKKRQLNNLMSHVPQIQKLTDQEKEKILGQLETSVIQKGTLITHTLGIYMVRSGELIIEKNDGTHEILKNGNHLVITGEEAYGMGIKSMKALTDLELVYLAKDKMG